jgi:PQQ-dependent dehydrogenase (methanol/ethanol family)
LRAPYAAAAIDGGSEKFEHTLRGRLPNRRRCPGTFLHSRRPLQILGYSLFFKHWPLYTAANVRRIARPAEIADIGAQPIIEGGMKKSVGFLALASICAAAVPALSQGLPALYTAQQASDGAALYAGQCAICHGAALEGSAAPALKGDGFRAMANAQKLTPTTLLAVTSQTMPQGASGLLTADQYRAITAYMLQQNGYPAGSQPFLADNACTACAAPLTSAPVAMAQAAPAGGIQHGEQAPAAAPAGRPAAVVPETVLAKAVDVDVNVTNGQQLNADKDLDNWLLFGRTYDNQRFSPLTQINLDNVKKLLPAAIIQTGILGSIEGNPIVVNGVMYVSTVSDHVMAFDAVTGHIMWTYTAKLRYSLTCCGPVSRGLAVAYGKVFIAQLDGDVVALDAKTGKVAWRSDPANALPEDPTFYSFTSAPQVYDGMVVIGNAGGEYPTRGFVEALDQATGKLVWRFRTTAAPGEPGGNSWSGDSWKYGGGSVWDTPAVDITNGTISFAVGNPNPVLNGDSRLGDNAYTDSMVGVNAKTGKLAWWYQMVPHDVWDYDAAAPVVLFDADDGHGKRVPAAGEASKEGHLWIVNRLTGKLIRKSDPFVAESPNKWIPPGDKPVTIYPAVNGGNIWSPPSYSPLTHNFYVPGIEMAWTYLGKDKIDPYVPGTPVVGQRSGGRMRGETDPNVPGALAPTGNFTALNVDTGKIAWQYKSPLPMEGGSLVTAGNLVFTGELTGEFEAFNATTGEKVWHYYLGTGVASPPVTYRVAGVQYIAVAASGGGSGGVTRVAANAGLVPQGDVVAIFAMPQ